MSEWLSEKWHAAKFKDAILWVAEANACVSLAQLAGRTMVFCIFDDAEYRVALRSAKRKRLGAYACTVNAERRRMARIGVMQLSSRNVCNQVARRHKHRKMGAFQNGGNSPVQFLKESRRFGLVHAQIIKERS